MSRFFAVCTLTFALAVSFAQAQPFHRADAPSRQDTLRGSITPERAWWNLLHYNLSVEVFPDDKSIAGTNTVTYEVVSASPGRLQIDLQAPMELAEVIQNGKTLSWEQEGSVYFLAIEEAQPIGSRQQLTLRWSGTPQEAARAPWDGGFTWTEDRNGTPFIATSNQGDGASVWWPCKEHPEDEPDEGVRMAVTVPKGLVQVGNGRLVDTQRGSRTTTWVWEVVNPINSYGVNINIGDYVHWEETYAGEKGPLDLSYWVLRQDEAAAREQFTQGALTLEALEHWFGPYPFYEDSYKLVQAPYLGMEHQSSVTYGNHFANGYLGRDLSQTGEGLSFDFIIVHESGHEWFANNITHQDVADLWLHEGFTCYSESLYLEYHEGQQAAYRYVRGLRSNITNDIPLIGEYGVNREGSHDMYYKGANMLHTIRMVVADDDKWRQTLRGLNETFYHQTVTSAQVEAYMAEQLDVHLEPIFNTYLRDVRIPTFTYRQMPNGTMLYRWSNVSPDFLMPVDITIDGTPHRLWAAPMFQELEGVPMDATVEVDPNYYIYLEDQTVR